MAEAVSRVSILPLTIEQYLRMIDQKIIPENATTELLRGVVVRKNRSSPGEDPIAHGPRHRMVVSLLTDLDHEGSIGPGSICRFSFPSPAPPTGRRNPMGRSFAARRATMRIECPDRAT